MLRLTTLGGLSLDGEEPQSGPSGPGPKSLLVLAVLSRCGARGMSRERLKALFWPESDAERAAQVLRQTLYGLRRSVGDVVVGTSDLRLDFNAVQVDSVRFEELAAAADEEAAIAMYAGPFLDGISVRGPADLEFWVDRQRLALANRFRTALLKVARQAETEDPANRLRLWVRAQEALPLDSEAAEGRIRAHLAVGDRIGALLFGSAFQTRLRQELDIELDRDLRSLLDQARVIDPAVEHARGTGSRTERPLSARPLTGAEITSSASALEEPPSEIVPASLPSAPAIDSRPKPRVRKQRTLIFSSLILLAGLMSARGREANLFQLVNTIAMEVLATQGGDARPIGRAARRSTSSLAALRSFLAGEDHFRAARYAPAVEAYQRANALDSTFALANYRLSEAADWVGNGDLMMDAVDRAFRHRNRLSLRDRMVVEATYHWRHGTIDRAELLLREVVKLYPDDAEAWYQLGEVQFHSAPARGRPISNATSAFRTALRLDSARTESLLHLARIAAIYGDHSRVDSLVSESIQRRSDATTAKLKGFAAFVHRDRQAIDRIVDSLRAIGSGDLYPLVLSAAQYATDLDAAARVAALLLDAPHEPEMRRSAAFLLASIQLARGHGDSAFRALAVIPNDAMSWGTAHRALLIEVPGAPQPSRAELLALRDSLRSWPHKIPPAVDSSKRRQSGFALNAPMFEQYPIALVSLRIGDTSAASAAARTLANQRGEVDERMLAAALAAAVEARIALIRADTVNALRLLESISPSVPLYLTGDLSGFTRERLLRARLLESRGRLREALTLYESLGQGSASGIAYAGAAMAARAALHERLGERSSAKILKARLGRTGVASRQCCVGWQTRPLTP